VDGNDLYLLRGVITTHTNDYFIANNTVKVTNKPRYAANYTSRHAASKAASYLCDSGDPYVVILSPFDKDEQIMKDQMYVLATDTENGRQYFSSASYNGVMVTDDMSEAAHYLSEESADAAIETLTGFDMVFEAEENGFWSEE
jgi:hypothetical protein